MDTTDSGRITFTVEIFIWQQFCRKINVQDFVRTLSVLEKGSLLERMTWIARLYDLDGDGYIARDDLEDIIFSVGILSSQPFPLSLSLFWANNHFPYIFFSFDYFFTPGKERRKIQNIHHCHWINWTRVSLFIQFLKQKIVLVWDVKCLEFNARIMFFIFPVPLHFPCK